MMPGRRRQFRILYGDFLRRIVDLDVLSSHGDVEKLLIQFAAALAAFNFTFLIVAGPGFFMGNWPPAQLRLAVGGAFEFLIAATMAAVGLLAVLAWNTVMPDRRDALVLGLLPVRARTIFFAKVAAIATALGVSVVAMNIFTGFTFPFLNAEGGWMAAVRSFAGYWLAMAAAGLFVCGGMLALQGLAALFLPYRLFQRASSFLQIAAFFGVLAAFFLKPPGTVPWLPSSWFFGLEQGISGAAPFGRLAARALWSLLGVSAVAAATFAVAYAGSIRKTVEQPDIVPTKRRRLPRFGYAVLPRPVDRAIVLFTARTIARSRQHRLILAAYAGIGLAVAFAYARDLLYGSSNPYDLGFAAHWNQLNVPLLMAGVVLVSFAVVGTRAIFALPVALRANWIFQITAVHPPRAYFSAVRKALLAVTVLPLLSLCAAGYFLVWPARAAAEHMLLLSIAAVLLAHRSLDQFRKIPFTCSYVPGKSNLHIMIGVYALALLAISRVAVEIEFESMPHPAGFAVFCAIWLLLTLLFWRRWRAFATAPYNWIQFEDLPPADIESLDLHSPPPSSSSAPLPPRRAGISVRPRTVFSIESGVSFEPVAAPSVPLGVRFRQVLSDLRAGLRIFRRAPGFSAAAIALMAVGIGGRLLANQRNPEQAGARNQNQKPCKHRRGYAR